MAGPDPKPAAPRIVVGGVSGSGKSVMAAALAGRLGVAFIEGDDLHSDEAKAKMHAGHPLTDADRAPWLDRVAQALAAAPGGAVAACSALKRDYRDRLRRGAPGLGVVMLEVPRDTLEWRLDHRPGHFMPAGLLDSQLETLEPPGADEPRTAVVSDDAAPDTVLQRMMAAVEGFAG